VGPGFSPLDEALGLLPGHLTPWLAESLVQLGTRLPFGQAAEVLWHFTQTSVSEATARRLTERAAAAWLQLDLAEVARGEGDLAEADAAPAPDLLQVSVDGAMVGLVGGEWGEVKLAAIGVVVRDAAGTVTTTELSYVARLTDAERFTQHALPELRRRGVDRAATVVGVADGASWIQGFLDWHCPDAVRILDFPHAVGYLAQAAQETWGPGTAATSEWLAVQAQTLKHGDPEDVLLALAALPPGPARDAALGYLGTRRAQITYAAFQAAGYPIGSGCVESGNKVVIEARLKGPGMHWTRDHADALAALRTVIANGRWADAWPRIAGQLRHAAHQPSARRRLARQPPRAGPTRPTTAAQPTAGIRCPGPGTPEDHRQRQTHRRPSVETIRPLSRRTETLTGTPYAVPHCWAPRARGRAGTRRPRAARGSAARR